MASRTDICDLALIHLGTSKTISSFLLGKSNEAKLCRVMFPRARDQMLRGFNWPAFTVIELLQLVSENPNDEWLFQYQYPVKAKFFRRILSGLRNDNSTSLVPYKIFRDPINSGKSVMCDMKDAQCEYTFCSDDQDEWDEDFSMALSFRLAYLLAPVITKNDVQNIQSQMLRLYNLEASIAMSNAKNEEQADPFPPSEIERARAGTNAQLRADDNVPFPSGFTLES